MSHGNVEAFAAPSDLPGPRPELFFAPDHAPDRDPASSWEDYCSWTSGWLTFSEHAGIEAAAAAWGRVLNGQVPPSEATVIATGEPA
jgi:hypothetical protein